MMNTKEDNTEDDTEGGTAFVERVCDACKGVGMFQSCLMCEGRGTVMVSDDEECRVMKEDNTMSNEPIPTWRILELIEASEAYPTYTRLIDAVAAYHDVAVLLRELMERRSAARRVVYN